MPAALHSTHSIIYYMSYWQTPLHETADGGGRIGYEQPETLTAQAHKQATAVSHTPCSSNKPATDTGLHGWHLLAVINTRRSSPGEYTPVRHYPVDPTGRSEPGTHAVIWCPCLAMVPVAQRLDEKRPVAIQFDIPARNRLWHTGRMASAICPWPLCIIDRYSIECPWCGIRSLADLQTGLHQPSALGLTGCESTILHGFQFAQTCQHH